MGGGHRGSHRIDSDRELVYVRYARESPEKEEPNGNLWEQEAKFGKLGERGG